MKRRQMILLGLLGIGVSLHPLAASEIWFVSGPRNGNQRASACRCEARFGAQPTRVYVPGHWTWRETASGRCYRKWEPGRWVIVERRAPICRCQPDCRPLHHPSFADRCGYR